MGEEEARDKKATIRITVHDTRKHKCIKVIIVFL